MSTDERQQRGVVMIGLSLSSVSEHNVWSCYDWVVVVVFRLLTQYLVVL
jgi:alkyl hydroperoxide reductase subunit AhpC